MNSSFEYEYALVVNKVPKSAINGLSLADHDPVDIEKALVEHQNYINALKDSNLEVIELEPDENYPDCVFVEDTAIAIGHRIFITNPVALSRRGEITNIQNRFKELENKLGLELFEVKNKEEAFIDGGDCCFTGREFIIGLSSRTNEKGIKELEKTFEDIPVIKCFLKNGLHLKCFLTMISKDTILIGNSDSAKYIRKQIEEQSKFIEFYKFVEIEKDDDGSANVLVLNNRLFYNQKFESIYRTIKEFQYYDNLNQTKGLANDELAKIDGALTCRSILFSKKI